MCAYTGTLNKRLVFRRSFVLCSFSCKTDDLIDKMTHYQHFPPDTCQALPLYESKVKMWQNQKRTDKRQTIKIYIFLNVENNKSEDMKTWEIWVAYGTHLHLVRLKFLPHHIAGSPNSHNIHRNNREKKTRQKKKKRYTVSKAQRITAISTTEKITYNSLHYNKKHKKFS